MMKGLSIMVNICLSYFTAFCNSFRTMCFFETVFKANRCFVAGSRSNVTSPKAPRPRMPIRSSARVPMTGSSFKTASASSPPPPPAAGVLPGLLRALPGVAVSVSLSNSDSKPLSLGTARAALYFANCSKSSSAARRKSSADKWPASSRKVEPSKTRHSTSCSELARTENSEGRPRSKARSPKCCGHCNFANSFPSTAPATAGFDMVHSPLVMMYQTSCSSPSWMSQSPCLNLAVRIFWANSSFSSDKSPCNKSTCPRRFTMRATRSCCVLRMMRRNCAWLTAHTTESSRATAVDVRGA
mmetsp:Transcript_103888/g.260545  ORF Transcript_103888/g.260545 Transcript_103888/m.260545 type:complete len:299 (+) Transcript_103888:1143-2039(+)